MRAPEVGGGARSRRRLQLHHGFTANKTGVPASGGLSTLVPGALGPQRSRRSSADLSLQAGRARLRQQFSIGPARAGPTRESALAIARASAPPPAISESTCVHSIATKDGSCMHAYTLSLSLGAPTSSYGLPGNLQYLTTTDTTYGDLEFWTPSALRRPAPSSCAGRNAHV